MVIGLGLIALWMVGCGDSDTTEPETIGQPTTDSSEEQSQIEGSATTTSSLSSSSSTETTTPASTQPDEPQLNLVVTTSIWGDVVKNVVGDHAGIEVLMPLGTDPHDYQASSRDIERIANADLVIANGLGLEEGLLEVLEAAQREGTELLLLADTIIHDDDEEHSSREKSDHLGDTDRNEGFEEGDSAAGIEQHSAAASSKPRFQTVSYYGNRPASHPVVLLYSEDDYDDEDDDHDDDDHDDDDHDDDDHDDDDHDDDDHDDDDSGSRSGSSTSSSSSSSTPSSSRSTVEEHGDDDHLEEDDHEDDHDDDTDGHHDEDGHEHLLGDPHIWLDPYLVSRAVEILVDQLNQLEPNPIWEERATIYQGEMFSAHQQVEQNLTVVPESQRKLITNHDSFGYFAERYGFEVLGTVIPGQSTLAQPSSADIADLVKVITDHNLPAIFTESFEGSTLPQVIAEEVGFEVAVVTLFTGSLGEPGSGAETLVGLWLTNSALIAEALS